MLLRRINVDDLDTELGAGARPRRFKSLRTIGLVAVAGFLAFGLWRGGIFETWAAKGKAKAQPAPITLTGAASVVDATEVGGARWLLLAQPTTDGTLCYQLADTNGTVGFPCTVGIEPMKPDSKDAAALIVPALSTEAAMPPVIMGSAANDVSRIELSVDSVTQRLVPVPSPETGRAAFLASIKTELARGFVEHPMLAVAYNANGKCVGAARGFPSGQMLLNSTKECPK